MPSPNFLTALSLAAELEPTPRNLKKVAEETDEAAARWAFGQWELRERAKGRFPHPERLLFVREALEQATHRGLSEYHATLFPPGELVVDLTCGIGGDLLALAARGPVLGFELDPERAEYARWNLAAMELEGRVRAEDGLAWLREAPAPFAFSDPARRVEGRRTLDPADFAPNPFEVAEAAIECRRWAMKLSPMMPDEILLQLAPRIEFVSYGGECREALTIGGTDPIPSGKWAVRPGQEPLEGGTPYAPTGPIDAWFYDTDPAAVRSGAVGGLARSLGLRALGEVTGYLTGPERVASPWLRAYRVIDSVAPKRLKTTLRALGADAPILKQRGARQDLDVWRKTLGRNGDRPVAVAFYLEGKSLQAAIMHLPIDA